MTRDELGTALRQRRMELGYSQRTVASAAGVSVSTYRRLEAGKTNARVGHTVIPVLAALGLQLVVER